MPPPSEAVRRAHHRHMREPLWEISCLSLRGDIVLLGQQTDVIGEREQPLEQRTGIVASPERGQRFYEPEGAGNERALPRWESIVKCRIVANDQSIDDEPLLDPFDGAPSARVA